MAKEKNWIISIIAQVNESNKKFYEEFEKEIKSHASENLKFIMFKLNQKGRSANILRFDQANCYPVTPEEKNVNIFDSKDTHLQEFFSNHVLNGEHKEFNHMLITWGHGAGLGYFSLEESQGTKSKNNPLGGEGVLQRIKEDEEVDYKKNKKTINISKAHEQILRSNLSQQGNAIVVDTHLEHSNPDELPLRSQLLTAEGLANILMRSGFTKNRPVNVFIANNCWVNMFEVGWALRNCVHIYASPQTILPFPGINYDKLFEALQDYDATNSGTPLKIARNITDNFLSKYPDSVVKEFHVDVRQISISVTNLKKYGAERSFEQIDYENADEAQLDNVGISEIINQLAGYLIEKLRGPEKKYFLERIDIARNYCGDFTQQGISFIDFTSFFCELLKSFQSDDADELKEMYRKFFFLKEEALFSLLSPPELFRFMPTDFYYQAPQMFSIFFPSRFGKSDATQKFLNLYFDPPYSEFQKASLWDDFIKEYWYS